MIPSHVDPKHLEAFILVLTRAKEFTGQLHQQNIWYDGNPSNSNDPSKLLDELKVLKAHKETMLRLRKSLEKRILLLQEPCNAITRQTGIKTLPPEILSPIFLLSCTSIGWDGEENQQAIHLSHVCRQFRQVALQTAALWTHLDNNQPLPETEEFLRRSGSSPLNITCRTGAWIDEFPEFLANISSHSLRWSEIDLRLEWPSADGLDDDTREHGLAFYRPNLPLPNLTSVHHTFFDDPFESLSEPWFDTPWLLPSLRSYTAVNVMPKPEFLSGSLTRCSLAWKQCSLDDEVDYDDLAPLIQTLECLKALQHLSFSFTDITFVLKASELPTATLPHVETLVLEAKGRLDVENVVTSLLLHLKLPNLCNLSWSADVTTESGDLHGLLYLSRGPTPSLSRLRRLQLADKRSQTSDMLETIISQCTSLLDLTLCIPDAELFSHERYFKQRREETFMRQFPLQTLTLKGWNAVSRGDLRCLVDTLRRGPNWDTFRRLEVNCCKCLSEDFLLSIEDMAEGKLKWTTPF
ncbi:hypothetical protein BD410DRAFT_841962 [Rickenella mellea]|uniref:F-box domain-containing protein n=1 Tax=Rickenella mellea TaxID=50990 RepID=A0A4Y7PW27_9AGAM|nr:hypothetical protein BD410DRAFT_841962 [Rickenella mellea]